MPIPNDLIRRNLAPRVLTPAAQVAELLYLCAEQPEPRKVFVVVRGGAGLFDVLLLDDLHEFADRYGAELAALPLGAVPGLLRFGAALIQAQAGEERAIREQAQRHRRRLVVLDAAGQILGVLASVSLGAAQGVSPLALIGVDEAGVPAPPPAPAHLHARFTGRAPTDPLIVGQPATLIVAVGAPTATGAAISRRFAFDFAGADGPVRFTVTVEADEELWQVQVVAPTLIVAPPGATTQPAVFTVLAQQPLQEKLLIRVARADTGAMVQTLWLPVCAVPATAPPARPPAALEPVAVVQPLDAPDLARPPVELIIQPGRAGASIVVCADLPSGVLRRTFRAPVSREAFQDATLRLREELAKIVTYELQRDGRAIRPFLDNSDLTIDAELARKVATPLADAGQQVWEMLFNPPRGDPGLHQFALALRELPHGSHLRIVLENQEFSVPWALLYDQPGPISARTLVWEGFWGYRAIIDAMPPGDYPVPTIADRPPGLLLLLNDDAGLHRFTSDQERFVREALALAQTTVAWGHSQVQQALISPPPAALVYCYCHGDHAGGARPRQRRSVTALASEAALFFSGGQGLRIADLRRLPAGPLASRPLVFLNACEGATRQAFYYDGFMPFFIEQQLARGFIGAEAVAPQLLAHDLALQFLRLFAQGRPVGEILWRLRRHYLDRHNNILAFNYSLYGQGDVRLAAPLLAAPEAAPRRDQAGDALLRGLPGPGS